MAKSEMKKKRRIKQGEIDRDLTGEIKPEPLWDHLTRIIPPEIILYDRKGEYPYINVSELMAYSEEQNKIPKVIMESVLGEFCYYTSTDCRYLDQLESEQFKKLYIALDPETEDYKSFARRPYYQMRGKRISEEQAIEIIARTDNYFRFHYDRELLEAANYVGCMNFDQWWIGKYHIPAHYGWCHPSGIIGGNAMTQKYPNILEFIEEAIRWAINFPALDIMIGVTEWDEKPYDPDDYSGSDPYEEYENFPDNIAIGINVHENTVEILNGKNARERYLIYDKMYGEEDRRVYIPEYYEDRGLFICDEQYLKRCEEILGIR
ncbi:MAG: hypothetical protein K6G83_08380 [Lachnospiraceae bacterium]|nr:hypothetical protein [Lachnospiraceae bacterium]